MTTAAVDRRIAIVGNVQDAPPLVLRAQDGRREGIQIRISAVPGRAPPVVRDRGEVRVRPFRDGRGGGTGDLVAVASFWSGRTISWVDRPFRSFKLLRFCTVKDATVVGGLTKLISAFVRDVDGRIKGEGWGLTSLRRSIATSGQRLMADLC
jgi:hypothetical protein